VTRDDIRYPQPMLIDQIEYLYSMLNRADQKPGKDAYERHQELQSQLNQYLSQIKPLITQKGIALSDNVYYQLLKLN
jgi:hypothetical protein